MSTFISAADIREAFLSYFEQHAHQRVSSSSLVPHNDPTLLFTNAGMVQFKDVFTGKENRSYSRATTSQKCVRAGGKHNDLDNVGFTARHHTFFEMLGNFSFGDYFKKEAIAFAWEFVTQRLKLDPQRLAVTVFNGERGLRWDEEAFDLWAHVGVPPTRIFKLGYKDNFWAMGDTGPCGPCSEIHFHQGDDLPCAEVSAGRPCQGVACDCDRWLEIWNLVFMQFERKEKDAELISLPKPSIDTGAGLERLASVVQGKRSNYDTDLFVPLLTHVSKLAQKPYQAHTADGASMRVISDHSRAAAFLIGDGVLPSNEGRGYVLRRIMRRAIRHGSKLGLNQLFLPSTVEAVLEQMSPVYPALADNKTFILEATRHEEESFRRTLDRGLKMIDEEISKLKQSGHRTLSGDAVFFLHDTHGFPWDLTQIIAQERGFEVDLSGYEARMTKQREQGSFAGSGEKAIGDVYLKIHQRVGDTQFLGYGENGETGEGVLQAIVHDGVEIPQAQAGQTVELVFDRTPFYGESGGQVGDTGELVAHGGKTTATVLDTQKPVGALFVHKVKIDMGLLKLGDVTQLSVDAQRRKAIRANHSATHLLHKALKLVLGDHVKQAGSVVAPESLRFDYSHFAPPTLEQLEKVEDVVNHWIRDNAASTTQVMGLEEAKKAGAVALFGEKYGDHVRVVSVHPQSIELCGGTHTQRSGDIGFFKVVSESSIAAGVRRMTAVTGSEALRFVRELDYELRRAADTLKVAPKDVVKRLEVTQRRIKELEKKVEEVQLRAQATPSGDLAQQVREVAGLKVLTRLIEPADAKIFRSLADQYRDQLKSGVVALGGKTEDGKALILVAATKDVVARGIQASDLVKALAKEINGTGGGKPDMAQAGGTSPANIPQALEKLYALLPKS